MEDVQRMLGAMALEIEMLRRENTYLRDVIEGKPVDKVPEPSS
jgi:hypothetical protein